MEAIVQTVKNLYGSVSFSAVTPPQYELLKEQFIETGVLVNNNGERPVCFSPDGFIQLVRETIASGSIAAFKETELYHNYEVFGKIAQYTSVYGYSFSPEGDEFAGYGINYIQLISTGDEWKVVSMIWNDETPDRPVPKEYKKQYANQ